MDNFWTSPIWRGLMSLIRGNVQETVDFPKDISSLIILKIELLPPPNLLSSVGFPVSAYGTRPMLVLESETWESPLIGSPEHPLPQFPHSVHHQVPLILIPNFHLSTISITTVATLVHAIIISLLDFSNHSLLTTILDSLWSSLRTRIIFLKCKAFHKSLLALNVQDRTCLYSS